MITIVNGKVEVTIKRLSNSIYTIVEHHQTFNDIGGHWAKSEIELLASKLVIKGMTDTTYKPDNSMTRAEIASLLVRALGLKEQTTAQFTDVASNQWYAGAVGAAVKAGLVTGVGNELFDPNANITREEMVVMISRALHMADKDVAVDVPLLLKFNDHKKISNWAEEQVSQVLKAGIINGNTVNTFAPKDDVTRAEAAVMLQRFLKYVEFMN
ncbi:S-layer homology domain-containing protein [Paenibacillus sp. FA6]|uniref:S-layer homology domain-containing protein n=1 Tax=Paenibacillus sp. FA6 TaxID=3413029 RepID=UPI003F65DCFF